MKYGLTPTKIVPKKNANFAAAVEALTESLDRMSSAYDDLKAAEGRVLECESVITNATMAVESIKQFGIAAQNMALLNGKDHDLDRALGMEDLDITSIETLSAATKDMLKSQYLTGLEGKTAEFFKALVERVKAFFAKLVGWLKELFTGTNKVKELVKALKFDGTGWKTDAKVSALSHDNFLGALGDLEKLGGWADKDDYEDITTQTKSYDKTYGTAKELGWTSPVLASEAMGRFLKLSSSEKFAKKWNKIQAQYRKDITANAENPESKDTLLHHLDDWRNSSKVTGLYNKLYKQCGFTLVALSKVQDKSDGTGQPQIAAR